MLQSKFISNKTRITMRETRLAYKRIWTATSTSLLGKAGHSILYTKAYFCYIRQVHDFKILDQG